MENKTMLDIIIAQSDEETRDLFYKTFTDLGYLATTVLTHQEILELLTKERPSHIILDAAISDISAETMSKKIALVDDTITVLIAPREKNVLRFIKDFIDIIINRRNIPPVQETSKLTAFKKRILMVDDQIGHLELIKNYLSRKGYITATASSGEEAIAKIKESRPDIVFLDICMQGIDGIITLKAIKDFDNSIIVIMTSGNDDRKIIKETIELGANGYLVKPFNLKKLEEIIISNI